MLPRVQLVGYDDETASTLASALGPREYDVRTSAEPPDDAPATVVPERASCVVTEVDVLGRAPLAFAQAVRDRRPDVSIVVYTDRGSEAVASRALSIGVDEYVRRSNGPAALRRAVDRVVDTRSRVADGTGDRAELEGVSPLENVADGLLESVLAVSPGVLVVDADGFVDAATDRAVDVLGLDRSRPRDVSSWTWTPLEETGGTRLETDPIRRVLETGESIRARRYALEVEPTSEAEIDSVPAERGKSDADASVGDCTRTTSNPIGIGPATDDRSIVSVSASLLEGDDGTRRRAIVSVVDVTESVEREREVARYRTIVETVDDVIYALDADGRIVLSNQALARYAGLERTDVLGTDVRELLTADAYEVGSELIRDLLESDETNSGRYEFEVERADGVVRTLENNISVMVDDGVFQGTVGVLRDVTERRTQTRTLERQNEQLDEFVSIVSHDLRNPLAVIDATAIQVAETGDLSELEQIEACTRRMDAMLTDLLALAREGRDVSEFERVSLERIARGAWGHVETGDWTLVVDDLGTVDADPDRLQRLFENLFRNAIEHGTDSDTTDPDRDPSTAPVGATGAVTGTAAGTVTVERTSDGFAVADDGPGIDREDRDRIFDRGFTTRPDGTGFGLDIVQRIAAAHGWSIALDEEYDAGARFVVRT